ncbi:LysE family transporter [Devosia sp. A8/3-2]|nr:LysE family transporter [Devosia sp. A8/3-2]
MEPFTLLTFTIAYAIAVLVPGPGVVAVVARALGGGFKGAFPMVLGILAGDLVYFVFAVFGLAAVATSVRSGLHHRPLGRCRLPALHRL